MKKVIIFLTVFVLIFTTAALPASARNYQSEIQLTCDVDYMISLDTGSVIVAKNENKRVPIASVTKITTALVVLQTCKNLNEVVTVSEMAIKSLDGTGSSLSGLQVGEQVTVLQLLNLLLVASGNDAAAVLAEHFGSTQAGFVAMMNKCAQKLGCKDTHYNNPHGLDTEDGYSTAHDIALIAQEALKYDTFVKIVATASYNMEATNKNQKRTLTNTNSTMNLAYKTYYRDYVKGIKTGTTDNAGYCLTSYASKNGYTYLAVALGGDRHDSDGDNIDENQAFMDTIRMYDWVFANLSYELVASTSLMVAEVKVNYSWKTDHMRLVPAEDVRALVPTGTDEGSVLVEPIDKPDEVNAPIKAGDVACKAKILYANSEIAQVNLVYAESVKRNYLSFVLTLLKRLVTNPIFLVLLGIVIAAAVAYMVYVFKMKSGRRRKKSGVRLVKINDMDSGARKKSNRNYKPKH